MKNDLKQGFARNLKFAETNAVLSLSLSLLIEKFSQLLRSCVGLYHTRFFFHTDSHHTHLSRLPCARIRH